jgi:uncharacterized protein (TIGR00266 family)
MTNEKFKIVGSEQVDDGTTVEILEYEELKGASDVRAAENLYFARQSGMALRMVRIKLSNSHIRVEPGALYYMKGDLEMKASSGGGLLKGLKRKMLSGESFFVNEIHGSGEIYLEPTFGHFYIHQISGAEEGIIVDKELFYAGTAGLDITAEMQKNVSSALLGGEGLFQTKIVGAGIAILYSAVPFDEVQKIELNGDKLSVDGNFAMMRSVGVDFKAEKSSKSWVSTSVSGEGLLQTFSGTGSVWLAPTQSVYEKLSTPQGLSELARVPASMHTDTGANK